MVIAIVILFVLLLVFPGIMLIITEGIIPSISLLFLGLAERKIINDALHNDGKVSLYEWNLLYCIFEVIDNRDDYFYFKYPSFPFGFIIEGYAMIYNLFGYVYKMYHCRKYDICIEKNDALTWNIDKYVDFFKKHNYKCHIHNRKVKSSYKDIYISSVPTICISNEANITFKMIIGQNLNDH